MLSRATLPIVGFLMLFGLAPVQPFGAMPQPQPHADEYVLQVHATARGHVWDAVVEVRVADAGTGFEYGTCTLSFSTSPGGCAFSAEPNSTVIATLNEATLPEGVDVVRNPVYSIVSAEKSDISFELEFVDDNAGDSGSAAGTDAAWDVWLSAAERMVDRLAP
jgi:hypothetical protein